MTRASSKVKFSVSDQGMTPVKERTSVTNKKKQRSMEKSDIQLQIEVKKV